MLNPSVQSGYPCIVLNLRGWKFRLLTLSTILTIGFTEGLFIKLRKFIFVSHFWEMDTGFGPVIFLCLLRGSCRLCHSFPYLLYWVNYFLPCILFLLLSLSFFFFFLIYMSCRTFNNLSINVGHGVTFVLFMILSGTYLELVYYVMFCCWFTRLKNVPLFLRYLWIFHGRYHLL